MVRTDLPAAARLSTATGSAQALAGRRLVVVSTRSVGWNTLRLCEPCADACKILRTIGTLPAQCRQRCGEMYGVLAGTATDLEYVAAVGEYTARIGSRLRSDAAEYGFLPII